MISVFATQSRITPAYAGKRHRSLLFFHPSQDHPRLRGEKRKAGMSAEEALGSPPLTRGKGSREEIQDSPAGITPAYAGKSCPSDFVLQRAGDHPRLRGEKPATRRPCGRLTGSPPLTRGKAAFGGENSFRVRITPAYAGKSGISH